MQEKPLFIGFGIVIGIMFLIAIVRGFAPDDTALSRSIAAEVEPLGAALSDLGDRLEASESDVASRLADIESAVETGVTTRLAELETGVVSRFEELEAAFGERLSALQAGVDGELQTLRDGLGALSERAGDAISAADLDALRDEMQSLETRSQEAVAALRAEAAALAPSSETGAAPEAEAEAAPAEDVVSLEDAEPGDPAAGLKPGQTALFSDGALRVFVSRIDAEDGRARVSLNGNDRMLRQGIGRTVASDFGFCRVLLEEVTRESGAVLTARCDAEMGEPLGIATGRTATLADGALRVFVSRVTEDAARLAVNGQVVRLEAGDRDVLQSGDLTCRLQLDQVDRGSAEVSAVCTDLVTRSLEMRAGQSAILGEGAARVFVSRVSDGAVRFALNGQQMQSGRPGDSVDLDGDCDLDVVAVGRKGALFSHACY